MSAWLRGTGSDTIGPAHFEIKGDKGERYFAEQDPGHWCLVSDLLKVRGKYWSSEDRPMDLKEVLEHVVVLGKHEKARFQVGVLRKVDDDGSIGDMPSLKELPLAADSRGEYVCGCVYLIRAVGGTSPDG